MNAFEYRRAQTLDEALELLAQYAGDVRILAGGTDLLVKMWNTRLRPRILVDPKGVRELQELRYDPVEGLTIGALVTIRDLETSPLIRSRFRGLSDAAGLLGSCQIRSRATVGGNLCNASPAADMAPSLIGLGAEARVISRMEERQVPLEEFFTGPGQTVLRDVELLASVHIPSPAPRGECRYVKHSIRRAMDLAIVGVAVALGTDEGDRCGDIRIALGAAGPVPIRARKAEERLRGRRLDDRSIQEASRMAVEDARPMSDIRASAGYRREMVRVLTERTVRQIRDALRQRSEPA
ncbi:MAG: hypothetical protein A3J75_05855 [Acidobacteria bacterium RBG_16_68_9]|nr:MAG: hypothetical protein A3J75_05855 [Acidobacteria bacterium RBG_16_68_9]